MKNQRLINIWGDIVGLFDLMKALIISAVLTLGGFFIANPTNPTQQLFLGLTGAVIAFIINSISIKPKRTLKEEVHG